MSSGESFTERALRFRKTKLLCAEHGVQPVHTVTEHGLAILECGCARSESLPVRDRALSVENLSPFAPKEDQKAAQCLFPGVVDNEITAQRKWYAAV